MLVSMLGSLVFGAGATPADTADPPDNPYQGIVGRNLFDLRTPPPAPDPESLKPPPPKFSLTCIATISGNKLAMLKTTPPPAKPGEAAKEQSYMLKEGQREGEVEVLHIDEVAGTVKVKYANTVEMTLDFTNNAAKVVAFAPVPGAPPGVPPGVPPAVSFPPIPGAGAANPALKQPFAPAIPRPIRSPRLGLMPAASASGLVGVAEQTGQPAQSAAAPITRDQQEVVMELLRDQHRNNPEFPPLPPTSLTPMIEAANQEAAAAASQANAAHTTTTTTGPPRFPPTSSNPQFGGPPPPPSPGQPF